MFNQMIGVHPTSTVSAYNMLLCIPQLLHVSSNLPPF
jgi:hypothetical protein